MPFSNPTIAEAIPVYNVAGVASSGNAKPDKADMRALLTAMETAIEGQAAQASFVFQTKAAMDAFLTASANQRAEVVADSTAANNGVYTKVGASGTGSWSLVTATNVTLLDGRLDIIEDSEPVARLPDIETRALAAAPALQEIDPDAIASQTDVLGGRLTWVDTRGRFRHAGEQDMPVAAIESSDAVIYTAHGTRVVVNASGPTPLAVQAMSYDRVAVAEDKAFYGADRVMIYGPVADAPPVPAGRILLHLPIYGQSLSVGSNGVAPFYQVPEEYYAASCYTLERVFGISDARGQLSGTSTSESFSAEEFIGLTKLVEQAADSGSYGQTIAAGMCTYLQQQAKANVGLPYHIACTATGVGGQNYTALADGTTPYTNTLTAVGLVRDVAENNGGVAVVPAIPLLHGESDVASATYQTNLETWQADFEPDIQSRTDQQAGVPFLLNQPSSFILSANNGSHIQMMAAMAANPAKFMVVSPNYHLHERNFVDGVHLAAPEYYDLGTYFGRALAYVLRGLNWKPLHVETITRVDANTIDVDWYVPVGEVVIDDAYVTDPNGQYGLRIWSAADSNIVIASVTKTAAKRLRIVTSDPLQTDSQLWVALNAQAATRDAANIPRCCIRDQDTYVSPRDGTTPLYNVAAHQNKAIPNS